VYDSGLTAGSHEAASGVGNRVVTGLSAADGHTVHAPTLPGRAPCARLPNHDCGLTLGPSASLAPYSCVPSSWAAFLWLLLLLSPDAGRPRGRCGIRGLAATAVCAQAHKPGPRLEPR
jgi:hypothetical protein